MAEYISREAFLADKKRLYCTDCDKRKGKKRGKMVTLYEIGEAPCKSCGIHDMLEEVELYPAADVLPRDEAITMGAELAAMHGSDATSQQLEEAYLKGVEDGMTRRDVRPVVHGRWKNIIQGIIPSGQCSNCGAWDKVTRFCPNCGADMIVVLTWGRVADGN